MGVGETPGVGMGGEEMGGAGGREGPGGVAKEGAWPRREVWPRGGWGAWPRMGGVAEGAVAKE